MKRKYSKNMLNNIKQQYQYGYFVQCLASRNGQRSAIMKRNVIQHTIYGNPNQSLFSLNYHRQISIPNIDDENDKLIELDYDPIDFNPIQGSNTSLKTFNRLIKLQKACQQYLSTPSPYQSNIDAISQNSMSISDEPNSDDMDQNSEYSLDNDIEEEMIYSPTRIDTQSKRKNSSRKTTKNRRRSRRRQKRQKLTKKQKNEKNIEQNLDNLQQLSYQIPERRLTSLERIVNDMFRHSFQIAKQKKSKQKFSEQPQSANQMKNRTSSQIKLNQEMPTNNTQYILYPPPPVND